MASKASGADARRQLIDFLDRKVFDPILRASPDKYTDAQKPKLEHVQKSTESERRRFHEDYSSAAEVRQRYLEDLHSSAAKRVNSELDKLKLPKLPDVKDEFLHLCGRLGVQ